jgi:hypothetical protein
VRRILLIALSAILALVVAIPVASGKPALPAISKDSQTLGELGAEWWTRVIEEPVPTNPLFGPYTDESRQCEASTTTFAKREVFFLVGTTTGAPVTRECTVSHKAWIFFPVVNSVDVEHPGDLSEAKMRKLVNDQIDQFLRGSTIFVTVDGKRVPVSKEKNRAGTPFFRVTLPKNNIFGGPPAAPAGKYKAVADGVWVLLPPLKKGTHTITFGGTFPNADLDPIKPGPEGFSQNNTYRLKVV